MTAGMSGECSGDYMVLRRGSNPWAGSKPVGGPCAREVSALSSPLFRAAGGASGLRSPSHLVPREPVTSEELPEPVRVVGG